MIKIKNKTFITLTSVLFFVLSLITPAAVNAQFTKSPDVALIWQADTYTPPFYLGKALKTAESTVTVLAIPNVIQGGARVPADSLVFTWKQDGVVLGSQSGLGRDTLIIPGSILSRPVDILVTVETQSGSVDTQRGIRIPVTTPLVHLYENSPLQGIRFGSALENTFRLQDEETTIEVFPYFFSIENRESGLAYQWRLGTVKLNTETNPTVILRQGDASGQIALSVDVTNIFKILEDARSNLNIDFGN